MISPRTHGAVGDELRLVRVVVLLDVFLGDHDLAGDHEGQQAVAQDALAHAVAHDVHGQALLHQLTFEFLLRKLAALHVLAQFVVHFAVLHGDLPAFRLLGHQDVGDHGFEHLQMHLAHRLLLGGVVAVKAKAHQLWGGLRLHVEEGYHLAVDHGCDLVDLFGPGSHDRNGGKADQKDGGGKAKGAEQRTQGALLFRGWGGGPGIGPAAEPGSIPRTGRPVRPLVPDFR